VIVDLGGIYFQQIVFALLAVAAVLGHDPSWRAACISIDVMALIAINPVFRFDGYWVLVDYLGIPNLHREAGLYLKQAIRSLLKLRWEAPQKPALRQNHFKTVVFITYALLGNLLLAVFVVWSVRWIQNIILGLIRNAPTMWTQIGAAINHHQMLKTLDLLTGLMFLLASGLTVIFALWFRGKEMLTISSSGHQ